MAAHPIRVLSLCTGAGGLDLGVRMACRTARTVCAVEIEAYAAEILAARMEEEALDDAPIWSDLRTFDGRPWRGRVDLVIGGYPCQPFSVAGRQRGSEDARHLWPDILRIIKEVEPVAVFFENVSNHLSLGGHEVLRSLQDMGFATAVTLLEAKEVGTPHKRQRIFILGVAHTGLPNHSRWGGDTGVAQGRGTQHQPAGSGSELAHADCGRCAPVESPGGGASEAVRREADAVPCGGVGQLAFATGGGQRVLRQSPGQAGQPERHGEAVAHAGCGCVSGRGGCGNMGTPSCCHAREGLQRERMRDAAGDGGAAVALTEHEGRQLSREEDHEDGRHARWRFFDGRDTGLPAFPPARDDFDLWRAVLAVDQAVEPAVRGVVDGLASRVDRLRLCGNGVVPHQAARAFRECWTALMESA